MSELAFYFDFSSPFAYLAATQVEALVARTGATLTYRPFLLGGLFKLIGTPDVPLFTMPTAKRRHVMLDLARWADFYGVPLRFPSRFPIHTVRALRMVLAAERAQQSALVGSIFRASWAEDVDLSSADALAGLASRAGADGPALVEAAAGEPMRHALRAATDEAVARGVCGAPCFAVGDLLFWGQDRMHFVEKALRSS